MFKEFVLLVIYKCLFWFKIRRRYYYVGEERKTKLWVEEFGHNNKKVAVLLMGAFGFVESLALQIRSFMKWNYRVIVVEYRGHGRSPITTDSKCSYEQDRDDVVEILRQMKISGEVVFYGLSDGAIVSILIAQKYPELVNSIVLSGAIVNFKNERYLRKVNRVLEKVKARGFQVRIMLLLWNLLNPGPGDIDLFLEKHTPFWIEGPKGFCYDTLKDIQDIPAFVLGVGRDVFIEQKEFELIRDGLPNCTYKYIADGDHMLTNHGGEVMEYIGEFLVNLNTSSIDKKEL